MGQTTDDDLPAGYTLRTASVSDSAGMAAVYDGAYPDDSGYPLQTTEAVRSKVFDADGFQPFVIEADDGTIAATASIQYDSVYEHNAEICRLAVHPEHQGHGLARTLLEHRLSVLEEATDVDVVFSAAVTSHPYSQHNLGARGFVPGAFLKRIQSSYFSEYRESQAIMIHPEWFTNADRDVYIPARLRSTVTHTLDELIGDRFGRTLVSLEIDAEYAGEPVTDRATRASKMGMWVDNPDDLTTAIADPGPELLAAVDANDPAAQTFYEKVFEYGLTPAGFIPNWLSVDGASRDAFIFQYRTDDEHIPIEATDELMTLFDALDLTYQITEQDEYTAVEL